MIQLGQLQLLERIGRGGMAEVWRAHHLGPASFKRAVAVKRILPHLRESPETLRLFAREAVHMAQLHHENIVTVIELAHVDDEYLIVMEYVDGVDLAQLADAQPRLPLGFALHVVTKLCSGVAHAHHLCDEAGRPLQLVHRDLSPSNVLVGRDGAVKITDFGVAKLLERASAQTQSQVRGKLAYMSPEQAAGERIDRRSDLFSIGVILYELVTGERPFGRAGTSLALRAGTEVAPPSRLVPELPAALDAVCLRALAADPEARFASGTAMQEALAPLVDELPWRREDTIALVAAAVPPIGEATVGSTASATVPSSRRARVVWLAAAAMAAVAIVVGVKRYAAPTPPPAMRAAPLPASPRVTELAAPTPPPPVTTSAAPALAAPPPAATSATPSRAHKRKRAPGDPSFPELRDPFAGRR